MVMAIDRAPRTPPPAQEKRGISSLFRGARADRRRKAQSTLRVAERPVALDREEENSLSVSIREVLTQLLGGKARRITAIGKDGFALRSRTGPREDESTVDTTVSTPRDPVSLDSLQTAMPRPRTVYFSNVVKELIIETREQRYGDLATKREAFYTHDELATFKRAWYLHIQSNDWPRGGLMKCGCPWCDTAEDGSLAESKGEPVVVEQGATLLQDYSKWTWEG